MDGQIVAESSEKPIGFAYGHIGTATKIRAYEDRHFWGHVVTALGMHISLAIVADGVGGGNLGQRAAQLAVETIVMACKKSSISNILQMLGGAIGQANRQVFEEAHKWSDRSEMTTTVAVAAIYNQRLYIANVGDSRIYLIKADQLHQITVDHTWANEHIRSGRLTREKANNHPYADILARSVGYEPKVRVDLGLYLHGEQESGAEAFKNQGLLLDVNDLVLVCSDGLIKTRHDGPGCYVENNEILRVVNSGSPEQAAKTLVDLSLGRNVDDNVTAIVIALPGRKRKLLSFLSRSI